MCIDIVWIWFGIANEQISSMFDGVICPQYGNGGVLSFCIFSSPEHKVLMVSYCGQSMSVIPRAASAIALKAYSSYTPGPIDLILSRKHRGDL